MLSKRGGVESVAAISLGPFVFLADVKDVRVEFAHHEGRAGWSLPRGVSEVRVIRKQGGPPKNPRDGDRLPAALDHALDRNLDPNEVYYYGIYAIYAMPDGRLFPRRGSWCRRGRSRRSRRWKLPGSCRNRAGESASTGSSRRAARSRFSARSAPLSSSPPALDSTTAEAEALDGRWIEPAGPDRALRHRAAGRGPLLLHAADGWGDIWTVGQSVAFSRVADPSELRDPRRQRLGLEHRGSRSAGDGPRGKRHAGRRSPGHSRPAARRSRRDHGDRPPRRLRSSGLLDAHLPLPPPAADVAATGSAGNANARESRIPAQCKVRSTPAHGTSGFTA